MNRKLLIILSVIGVLVSGIFISAYVYKWEYSKVQFEVNFFSLKRGRAIYIRTPDRKSILVGGGQNSEVIRELTRVRPFYNRNIDYIFIPSATPAQIGGLIEVVERYNVDEIFISDPIATSTVLTQLLKKIRSKKIHMTELKRGDRLKLGVIEVEVLFPINDFKYNKSSLPELGLKFSYYKTEFFLIGNLSKTIQKFIVNGIGDVGEENIVELYNSATKNKVSDELMNKLNPKYIFSTKEKSTRWISDGFSWEHL